MCELLALIFSQINNNIRIIRPLFNINKQELVDYLTANNIKWFEDESNTSSKYQRNRIRLFLNQNENSMLFYSNPHFSSGAFCCLPRQAHSWGVGGQATLLGHVGHNC